MHKKIILYLVFLIVISVASADVVTEDEWNTLAPEERTQAVNDPSVQLTPEQVRQVPVSAMDANAVNRYAGSMSPQQISDAFDQDKVTDQTLGKLDFNQLQSNINKIPENKWNLIRPDALSQILSQKAPGTNADLGNQPTDGEVRQDGFWLSRASTLSIGKVNIINGQGITYQNGIIHVEEAESVLFGSSYTTNVGNITIYTDTIRIESADMVVANCVIAEDVRTTTFNVDGGVKLTPYANVQYPVEVGSTGMDFASSTAGSMNVRCLTPPSVSIANSVINITRGDITERIEANSTVRFTLSSFGVECMDMEPLATYYYIYKNSMERDFSARAAINNYHLCIKKNPAQQVNNISCAQCGIIDLVAKKMMFNGIIYYRRYLFRQLNDNYALLSLNQENIYFPQNNASASFDCDYDNRFLSAEKIRSNYPPISSFVSTFLSLFEINTGQSTQRMVDINEQLETDEISQNLIEDYTTTYDPTDTRITNNMLEHGRITILPPGHSMIRQLTLEIQNTQPSYTG